MHRASSKCVCCFALVGRFTVLANRMVYQLGSSKKQEPRRDQILEGFVGGLALRMKRREQEVAEGAVSR